MVAVAGTQLNTIHVNPVEQHMVLTAGNDWMARLFDLRVLISSLPSATSTPAGGPPPFS